MSIKLIYTLDNVVKGMGKAYTFNKKACQLRQAFYTLSRLYLVCCFRESGNGIAQVIHRNVAIFFQYTLACR